MKIIFDQGTPRPLRRFLPGHEVQTSVRMGWSELENGILLRRAEGNFDLLITTDKSIRYQQNLRGRQLAILVPPVPDWNIVKLHVDQILQAVNAMRPGDYRELTW